MKEYAVNDIVTGFKWVGTRPIRPDGVPKVTGRAMYAADYTMAGAIIGKILRSPHAHARIRSINTSKAEKLPGVKAVITAKDFPEQKFEYIGPERVAVNFWHVTRNIMAREKTLYEGHAVAAVAAIDAATADEALSLIEVDYEVLPHVIDVDEAMKEDAPLLFEDMITRGIERRRLSSSFRLYSPAMARTDRRWRSSTSMGERAPRSWRSCAVCPTCSRCDRSSFDPRT